MSYTPKTPDRRQLDREIGLLAALAFMLPLFEAPKNLLWLAYLALWAWHRWPSRQPVGIAEGGPAATGGSGWTAWVRWTAWDGLVLATLVLALAGTALSGLKGQEWVGVRDLFRYLPLLWVLSRSSYSRTQWVRIFASLVAGTVLATGWGLWVWWRSGVAEMGLHSVGHSNHSATYLCIVFAVALALALPEPKSGTPPPAVADDRAGAGTERRAMPTLLAWLAAALIAVGVLATGSRIGLAVTVALAVLLPLVLALRPGGSRRPLAGILLAGAVCAAIIAVSQPWVLRKHQRNLNDNNVLAYRDALWGQALTAWRAHPWWGVGMDNFARIDLPRLNAWEAGQGRPLSPPGTYQSVHAHSLFLDALAERGLIGTGCLAGLFALWAVALWRRRPILTADSSRDGRAWGAAFGAAFATLGVGLVNTTLHTELALAAMLCLGALAGRDVPHDQAGDP